MYALVSVYICVCVPVSLCHCARQAGCVAWWQSRALYVCVCVCVFVCVWCVCVCVWSRCAWPPCAACCPSVLPSVCRLRLCSANSTTPWQEDPGERDAERQGEGWKERERKMDGRRRRSEEQGGKMEGVAERSERGVTRLGVWRGGKEAKESGRGKGRGLWV